MPDIVSPDGDQRIHRILASVPAAIALLSGPTHVFEGYNDQYLDLVGRGRELAGLPVAEALPEVVEQGFVDLLDGVYRTGEPFVGRELEVMLERVEGEALEQAFVDVAYIATRDTDGTIDGIIAHAVEVTSLVRAREEAVSLSRELEVERGRLQEVIEQLRAGVAIADADGRLVLANRSWRDTFQMEDAELAEIQGVDDYVAFVGYRPDGTAYTPEEYPIARALIDDEHVRDERIRFVLPDGRERIIDLTATRIRSQADDPVTAMVTTIDMTDDLALIDEVTRARRREIEADRRRAYEMNDTVVQRLAVADLAFGLGLQDEAMQAVRDALTIAKQLINDWGGSETDLALSRAPALGATEHDD